MSIIAGPDIIQALDVVCYELPQAPGWNFNWMIPSNGILLSPNDKNSIVVQWLSPGAGTIMATEPGGPVTLPVNVQPQTGIFGPTQTKQGEPVTYFVPFAPGFIYNWQIGGAGIMLSPPNQNGVIIQWVGTGNQQVTLTINGLAQPIHNVYVDTYASITTRSAVNSNDICAATLNGGTSATPNWQAFGGGGNIITTGTDNCAIQWGSGGQGVIYAQDIINGISYCHPVYVGVSGSLLGPSEVQAGDVYIYGTQHSGIANSPYAWFVSGNGNIASGINSNMACVQWNNPGSAVLQLTDNTAGVFFKHILIADTSFISGLAQGIAPESYPYRITTSGASYTWSTFGSALPVLSVTDDLYIAGFSSGTSLIYTEDISGIKYFKPTWSEIAQISGPPVCNKGEIVTYWVPYTSGEIYNWEVVGGEIEETYLNKVKIKWTGIGAKAVIVQYASTGETLALPVCIADRQIEHMMLAQANTANDYSVVNALETDTFDWYLSNNIASFTGDSVGLNYVNVDYGTAGSVWIVAKNISDNAFAGIIRIYDFPQPSVSGVDQACANGPEVQYSSSYSNSDFLYWSISGGSIIETTPGTITVQWETPGTGLVTLRQSNDAVAAIDYREVQLTLKPEPQISGPASIIAGKIETYSAASTGNEYAWSVTGGDLISGQGTPSIMVLWPASDTKYNGTVALEESNTYCSAETAQLNTVISPIPAPEIQGEVDVCELTTHTYSVFNSNNTFAWEVEGGTISAGQGTHTISVLWNDMLSNSKGKVKVTETNAFSVSLSSELVIDVFVMPSPAIVGPLTVGASGISVYEVYDTGNAFVWTVTQGNILSGQGTCRIEVQWNNVSTQTSAQVEIEEECLVCASNPVVDSINVVIKAIPYPNLTGDDEACTDTTKTYNTTDHGNDIAWEVIGGEVINTHTNPPGIDVKWATVTEKTYGSVKVIESSPYTNPGTVSLVKEVKIVPVAAPAITGPLAMVATGYSAYKTPASGNNFIWSLPAGGTIEAGQGTNCICVKWNNITGGPNTYTISVTEFNGVCSTDNISTQIDVTVYDDAASSFTDLQKNITLTRIGRDSLLENIILKNERVKIINEGLFVLNRQERPLNDPRREDLDDEKQLFSNDISIFIAAVEFNNTLLDVYLTDINVNTPADLVANLDNAIPHALFPVRLETKFKKFDDNGTDKYKIRVRIYPDDLLVHTHEESLTPWEISTAKDYWLKVWDNNTEQTQRDAWAHVAKHFSSQRASWIIKQLTPTNLALIATAPSPLFPLPGIKTSSWTQQPEVRIMPDKFQVNVYYKSTASADYTHLTGEFFNQVDDRLKCGIDPFNDESLKLNDTSPDDEKLEFGGGIEWMSEYDDAVAKGMAGDIILTGINSLTNTDIEEGIFKVVVIGVRYTTDEIHSATRIEEFVDAKHYTSTGIEVLGKNYQVGNSGGKDSSYVRDESPENTFATELKSPLFTTQSAYKDKADGQRIAELFGLSPEKLQHVKNSQLLSHLGPLRTNNALWASTIGYYLGDLWYESITRQELDLTRQFFVNNVSAAGTIPSLRIHNNIYGILPVSDYDNWQWEGSDPDVAYLTKLTQTSNIFKTAWRNKIANVEYASKPEPSGLNKNQRLFDIISLQPVSMSYYHRFALGLDFLWNHKSFSNVMNDASAWYTDRITEIQDLWDDMGLSNSGKNIPYDYPKMMRLRFFNEAKGKMRQALVQNQKLSWTDPLLSLPVDGNYLHWLANADFDKLTAEIFTAPNTPPNNLLYLLGRHAILLEYWRAAMDAYILAGGPPLQNGWTDAEFLDFGNLSTTNPHPTSLDIMQTGVSKWQVLNDTTIMPPFNMAKNLDNTPTAEILGVRADFEYLAGRPSAEVDLLLRQHLDLCSYRLDAWQTGMANRRIYTYKDPQSLAYKPGIYLGAYGWVEDLNVKTRTYLPENTIDGITGDVEDTEGRLGYIFAPSMNQASAAALLKSGYDSVKDEEWGSEYGYPRRIGLSSERVRKAMHIFDALKNGQELGVILGNEFERNVRERIGSQGVDVVETLLDIFRSNFLFDPVTAAETGQPLEKSQAKVNVNGFRLYRRTRQEAGAEYPYEIIGSLPAFNTTDSDEMAQVEAIETSLDLIAESIDALGDLCMAEASYQLLLENFDASTAIANLVQKGEDFPKRMDIIEGDDTGAALMQRYALTFPATGINSISGWPSTFTLRAKTEPYLNKWLGLKLPEGENIFCTVQFLQLDSDTPVDLTASGVTSNTYTTDIVSPANLDLHPIDLLYLTENDYNNDETALSQLIRYYTRNKFSLPATTDIFVDYQSRQALPTGACTFYDVLPTLRHLNKIITDSRPLTALDFMFGHELKNGVDNGCDVNEMFGRLNNALAELNNLSATLALIKTRITEDKALAQDYIVLQNVLLQAAKAGISGAIPSYAIETSNAVKNNWLAQVTAVQDDLNKKITPATAQLVTAQSALGNTPSADVTTMLTDVAKALFGKPFMLVPRFRLFNPDEVSAAYTAAPLILPTNVPLPMEEWMQGISKVRGKLTVVDNLNTFTEMLLGEEPELRPLQLPYMANDKWYGMKNDDVDHEASKLSVVVQPFDATVTGADFTDWCTGILADEWNEIIPYPKQTAGLAFNYDKPVAKAPNCILLAVSPVVDGNGWNFEHLLGTVNAALELSKIRAVDPQLLGDSEYGHILRAVVTAYQPQKETITSEIERAFTINP